MADGRVRARQVGEEHGERDDGEEGAKPVHAGTGGAVRVRHLSGGGRARHRVLAAPMRATGRRAGRAGRASNWKKQKRDGAICREKERKTQKKVKTKKKDNRKEKKSEKEKRNG